jgi:hypothetical protein
LHKKKESPLLPLPFLRSNLGNIFQPFLLLAIQTEQHLFARNFLSGTTQNYLSAMVAS